MVAFLIALFVTVATSFAIFYLKCIYDSFYWKRRGIPGPYQLKSNSIENQAPLIFNPDAPNIYQFRKWTKEYGPVFGYNEGQRKILVVSDPRIANEVMVKKFEYFHGRKLNPIIGNVDTEPRVHVFNAKGARWKRLRATANQCFTVAILKKILPTIDECANVTVSFLDQAFEKGAPFNIHPYFHEFTMDSISRIALGQKDSRQFKNPNTELVKQMLFKFSNNPIDYWAHVFPGLGPLFRKLFFTLGRFTKMPLTELIDQLYVTVDRRKEERLVNPRNESSCDFIDVFLDVEVDTAVDEAFQKTNMKVSKKLTRDEVTGQCFAFLVAGFDTTAITLSTTTWFLAKNPKIQEKLIEEIDDVCGRDSTKVLTYEKLSSLRFADMVLREVLRFHPASASAATRECQIPTTIGAAGIPIEKDVCIVLDLYTLHFDKAIWGSYADEFRPERFEDLTPLQQMSYYPFGAGVRECVGKRLAILEAKMALVKILQKYYIRKCPETEESLRMLGITIQSPEKVTVLLEKR